MVNICLMGNPNCGKTTLFNGLTGTFNRVGNFTGVTVEKKEGKYKKDKNINIIDLPGLYSLTSNSLDEKVVSDYLIKTPPNVIINIVDGTNLERNLMLTLSLLKLKIPVVVAVNFVDELNKNGIKLKAKELSNLLGVKVVPISALKKSNIDLLVKIAKEEKTLPNIKTVKEEYPFIKKVASSVIESKPIKAEIKTQKIDNILLNKFLAIPIFFAIMFVVYYLSFKVGKLLESPINSLIENYLGLTKKSLTSFSFKPWAIDLITNCVIGGVGTVLGFLPQILLLFFFMTIIEESGYSSRIAFIFDRAFSSVNLSGKSIVPLFLSSGCAVTGIMSARVIENSSERKKIIFLSPFMPCGAKTAVFGWLSKIFFNGSALVSVSLYFLSIICVFVFGKVLCLFKGFNDNGTFILEIPTLRFPSIKNIFFVLKEKVKEFLVKAGTVIFLVSVIIFVLSNFGITGYVDGDIEKSFLFYIGSVLKYVFYPLGFFNWQTAVAVVSSFLAKESVIETLTILGVSESMFSSNFAVYGFMAFIMLSPPCIATLSIARKELNNNKDFLFMFIFQFLCGYVVALLLNVIGNFYIYNSGLIFSIIAGIIILIITKKCFKKAITCNCKNCSICKGKLCQTKKHNTTI